MVPQSLRRWFVVHFIADMLAAIPLFVAPVQVLGWLGWTAVDPISTRLVAAALFGIGIESYLGRNASADAFRAMLNLKVIWSATAAIGVLWSQLEGGPMAGWGVFGIFAVFHVAWLRYRLGLRPTSA
ncbi:MAG: hypothetical protein H0T89_34870 [Deltaproteobacteria bacterium]|nr:hypothetical protein [Deltaproteobacteria bacterium]MDQ3297521.1 hypothetical protein [Myxococcota bacterium]